MSNTWFRVKEGIFPLLFLSDTPHYENVPFEIPDNWVWTTLSEVGTWQSGGTPSRSNKSYYGGNIPWLKTGDLNDGLISDIPESITEEAIANSSTKINPTGSVLIAMYGATIGKLGILTFPAATNQACCACIEYEAVDQMYLFYFLLSQRTAFIEKGGGGAQPNISKEIIVNTYIPLPSLSEQHRIVSEIKRWFALIDQIEQGKSDLQTIIKQTKSKILDLAIHGKLVPQDPNDEPAIELLKRINPDFTPCDNGHSEKLPQGWSITELTNLADIKNGYAFKSSNYISSNGVRLIRIANVQDGYIEDKMPQFYPFDKMKALKDFMLTEGDILMSLTGNVGRVGILTNELLPAALNQRVACIKEHPNIIAKKFLFYTFQTSNFSKDCVKSGKGVAQLNISTEWLKHYFILIPPLTEQQRIVQKIEELFSVLDNIQNALEV